MDLTPLMEAAQNGHMGVVQLLVSRGADVRLRDYRKRTAEQLAKAKGHEEVVVFLHGLGDEPPGYPSAPELEALLLPSYEASVQGSVKREDPDSHDEQQS